MQSTASTVRRPLQRCGSSRGASSSASPSTATSARARCERRLDELFADPLPGCELPDDNTFTDVKTLTEDASAPSGQLLGFVIPGVTCQIKPPSPRPPAGTFRRAATISAYIDLIREAEKRLIAAGVTTADERIQILWTPRVRESAPQARVR